jgi:hypothetical protein
MKQGAVAVCGLVCWVLLASVLLCWLAGNVHLFVWPFMQWIDAVPYWFRVGWRMKVNIGLAGGLATLVLLAVAIGWFRKPRSITPPRIRQWLFGDSRWSTEAEQRSNRIITTRGPLG